MMSDEQLRSLADQSQKELVRRQEIVRRTIRGEFEARLKELGCTIADIHPELKGSFTEKNKGKMMDGAFLSWR